MVLIYKIVPEKLWQKAEAKGRFDGSTVDLADGFIHFSQAGQLAETAAKWFSSQTDLWLLAVDADRLGEALRFEPSRGGALFPHLYAPLPLAAVIAARPLPLRPDGRHDFTGLLD
ncbi:MAG: DUF952 domain-containing protein [Alphaproteobacteria bacterium]|nr:DUF952 domain-containing protein [Alphaproteobacteria bacterium]